MAVQSFVLCCFWSVWGNLFQRGVASVVQGSSSLQASVSGAVVIGRTCNGKIN